MTWWYEIRDSGDRVFETGRGFSTREEAEEVGERARRTMLDISPGKALKLLTGEDASRSK